MNSFNEDDRKEWVSPAIIEEDFTKTELGQGGSEDGEGFEIGDIIPPS